MPREARQGIMKTALAIIVKVRRIEVSLQTHNGPTYKEIDLGYLIFLVSIPKLLESAHFQILADFWIHEA